MKNINSSLKYEFSSDLINYLGIYSKPYTFDEITNIIKTKKFNNKNSKSITWEEKDIFNISKNIKLKYTFVINYILNNFIKNLNEPTYYYYYYYQQPIEIKRLDSILN